MSTVYDESKVIHFENWAHVEKQASTMTSNTWLSEWFDTNEFQNQNLPLLVDNVNCSQLRQFCEKGMSICTMKPQHMKYFYIVFDVLVNFCKNCFPSNYKIVTAINNAGVDSQTYDQVLKYKNVIMKQIIEHKRNNKEELLLNDCIFTKPFQTQLFQQCCEKLYSANRTSMLFLCIANK